MKGKLKMKTNMKMFQTLVVTLLFVLSITSMSGVSAYNSNKVDRMGPAVVPNELPSYDAWTGFSINSSAGTYNYVSVTLNVPKISCNSTLLSEYGFQSTNWGVYADGFNANDFAGAYVSGNCIIYGGSVVSFYVVGFFSSATTGPNSGRVPWTPKAGDKIELILKQSGSDYHFSVYDETSYNYNYTTLAAGTVSDNAVECITDMGANSTGYPYPNVKFTPVHFNDCKVGGPKFKTTLMANAPGGGTLDEWVNLNHEGTAFLSIPYVTPYSSANDFTKNFYVTFANNGP
jgi:hypothetical protein